MRIALLGFLPWTDPARNAAVIENPAALAAEACAKGFAEFVPIPVSGDGIQQAMDRIRTMNAELVVAVGQTSTGPRVERFGRVPGAWAPTADGELNPWELAPDAQALAHHLNEFDDPAALIDPFVASEDAGGYFCDHLCVELAREARWRPLLARFLHVTAIDGCPAEVCAARLRQYERQIRATVEWLRR